MSCTSAPSVVLLKKNAEKNLFDLPAHVLEKILKNLTYSEISGLRLVCRAMTAVCGRLLRLAVRRLRMDIESQMKVLYEELTSVDEDNVTVRLSLFRCYNIMEVLRAELSLLYTLCRNTFTDENLCFPGGHILDHYVEVLAQVKARALPDLGLDSEITCHLLGLSERFLDSFMREYPLATRLGVRIVDLMDLLLDSGVYLNVTYDCRVETCHVISEYKYANAYHLCAPPEVADERALNEEEARTVLDFVMNTVRFNNRKLLRDEQYWREMEATRRLQEELGLQGFAISPAQHRIISRHPREYLASRICRERRVLSSDGLIIGEIYKEYVSKNNRESSCRVELTCTISESPLLIQEAWQRLCEDMEHGNSVELVSSVDDRKEVRILEYLELPKTDKSATFSTEYGSSLEEEVVGVHYPTRALAKQHSSESLDVSGTTEALEAEVELPGDIYDSSVDMVIFLPTRPMKADAYKLSFHDGGHSVHESEIRETPL